MRSMPIQRFPSPRQAGPNEIIALGGDLHPESLVLAYENGIFPWPIEGYPLAWFCPPERAILEYERIHLPKSLKKALKKSNWKFTIDQDFETVIGACSQAPRPGQKGTWITPEMNLAYCHLHRLGIAHSLEVWEENELIGGIYGVEVKGAFAGESMFHRRPNASKLALLQLMEFLYSKGVSWIDIQVMTPHLEVLGARLIPRDEFLSKLEQTHALGLKPFAKRFP